MLSCPGPYVAFTALTFADLPASDDRLIEALGVGQPLDGCFVFTAFPHGHWVTLSYPRRSE